MFVAVVALICYQRTLLPGLDLGDSASFQTGIGSLTLSPRQAYPLYYGLGNIFAWLDPHEPAHALNLASAVYGAVAAGLAVWLTAVLAESLLAGAAAGLFLAFSYTFWSQAITAEVYTLHLLVMGAALIALLAWAARPTLPRLALFYALYALGFGNHLSMVLLLPGCALFILMHRPRGGADPLSPRAIAMAIGIAGAAALQYAWNFRGMWWDLEPPSGVGAALLKFWVDVTKADWRETLVMGVSDTGLQNRPAMYWFDLRQQFGAPGIVFAAMGFCYMTIRWPRRGLLLLALYSTALAFAWTYNVGDAYIFFLPSHYIVALCAGSGVAAIGWLCSRVTRYDVAAGLGALCLLYPVWRGYDTLPAVDRSGDRRAEALLDAMTAPLNVESGSPLCRDAVFGMDVNWQVQNAAEYYMSRRKPGVPWFTTAEFVWPAPHAQALSRFVSDNIRAGREVVVNSRPGDGGWPETRATSFIDDLEGLGAGVPYVLGVLSPHDEFPIDPARFEAAWKVLAGNGQAPPMIKKYTIAVGRTGEPPQLVRADDRPFRAATHIGTIPLDIRMESWLPTDTIRRSGFGHVLINHVHGLTLERGISLLALDPSGRPLMSEYEAGLFASPRRFIVRPPENATQPCSR